MRRREFLKVAPSLGVVGFAGCPRETAESITLPWSQLPGPSGGPVTYISISDADPSAIYAAGRTAGIFASNDGGTSWRQGFSGQHHRSRIWASPHDPKFAFTHREWTDNAGRKWHHPDWSNRELYAPAAAPATSLGGPTVSRAYNIEWDPFDENTIYAATPEGLFLSSNAGQGWEKRSIGDIKLPPHFRGWDFSIHPTREGLIKVGIGNNVATSFDRGKTWSIFNLGDEYPRTGDKFIRGIEFTGSKSENTHLAIEGVGVFRVNEKTVTELSDGLPSLVFPKYDLPLTVSPDYQKLYFIAGKSSEMYPMRQWWNDRKLYEYDQSVSELNTVETPIKPNAISTHPDDRSTLFIGGDSWIHKSQDGGETWKALSNGFVDHYLATVAVNETRPETVFPGSYCSTGLSVSRDNGQTYEWKRSGLYPWHTEDAFGEHYLMHITARGDQVYATTAAGLLISEDNGKTWQMLDNRFSGEGEYGKPHTHLHGLAMHPEDPETVFVGTGRGGVGGEKTDVFPGAKIWKSTDGGETWRERTAGFPTDADTSVQDIVMNPHIPEIVYVATVAHNEYKGSKSGGEGVGLYKSTDGGESWKTLPTAFTNIYALSVDAADAETLYASSPKPEPQENRGVYRSTDGGQSWTKILPHETHALVAHPAEPGVLFAGADKYEDYWDVLVSEDGGDTWKEGNLRIRKSTNPTRERDYDATELHSDYWGNASGQPMWFALDETNSFLYVATNGVGLWRADTSLVEGG